MSILSVDESRQRAKLKYTLKLLLFMAAAWLVWVFISFAIGPVSDNRLQWQPLDVSGLSPGEVAYYVSGNRQLLVLHRDDRMIQCLQANRPVLYDPDSRFSRQPPALTGDFRSVTPDYFIAYAHEPDMGCPVEYLGADKAADSRCSGFRDVCRGSYYDVAGRVYAGQRGTKNLTVPTYRQSQNSLIQIRTEKEWQPRKTN